MRKWVNKVNLSSFSTKNLFQILACVISAQKAKQVDLITMFTYPHANTPLGQSERVYYLSYFVKSNTKQSVRSSLTYAIRYKYGVRLSLT